MLIKDADLIVAVGKEIRMTSLTEFQLSASEEQAFKVRKSRDVLVRYVSLIPTYHPRHCVRKTCNSRSTNSC